MMRSQVTGALALLVIAASVCSGQRWEIGGLGGYGWYHDATITNQGGSASVGIAPKGSIGAVFGEDMYKYIGGEVRWMYILGQPQVRANGIELARPGFSNVVHYDLLVHVAPQEAKLRPFVAVGGGVRVYSVSRRDLDRNTPFGYPRSRNDAQALISAGAGVKYLVAHGLQLRLDFRTYMTPVPGDIFRLPGSSITHGWLYNFVPSVGVGYVF
jgi:hypothetical protein